MEDLFEVIGIDLQCALVGLLRRPCRSVHGLEIGSPLSAGGAGLVASFREFRLWNLQTSNIHWEMWRRMLVARWADDLWVLVKMPVSAGVRLLLQSFLAERFYGHRLMLVRSRTAEAFGFGGAQQDGLVALRPILKFVGVEMPEKQKVREPLGEGCVLQGKIAHKVYHGG